MNDPVVFTHNRTVPTPPRFFSYKKTRQNCNRRGTSRESGWSYTSPRGFCIVISSQAAPQWSYFAVRQSPIWQQDVKETRLSLTLSRGTHIVHDASSANRCNFTNSQSAPLLVIITKKPSLTIALKSNGPFHLTEEVFLHSKSKAPREKWKRSLFFITLLFTWSL